jgi:SAM-dependent methyltransferase
MSQRKAGRGGRHGAPGFYERYWQEETPVPEGDPTTPTRRKAIRECLIRYGAIPPPGGGRALDIGCGGGLFLEHLAELGYQVHGVDMAWAAIERARRRCPGAKLYMGSLEEGLACEAESFGVVWCSEVLEHLFDVPHALREVNRVLEQDGLFLVSVPFHGLWKNLAIVVGGFDRHFDVTGPHIRFFTKRSLAGCLEAAGFDVLEWRLLGRVWPVPRSVFCAARKCGPPASSKGMRS